MPQVQGGHPDRAGAWTGASTLNRMVDLALYAHDDWFATGQADLAALAGADEARGDFALRHAAALAPAAAPALVTALFQTFGDDPAALARDASPEDRHGLATAAVALAALSPDFLLR